MALIDLKTDLKSLKYGLDRRGLGSSKEPFITKTIPEGETSGATLDFLLRQGALQSGLDDVSRLTQLFATTKGLSFITNQNLLSATSVKTESTRNNIGYAGGLINQGVYAPTSTLAQSVAGIGGLHLNFLGLNPLSPLAGVTEGKIVQSNSDSFLGNFAQNLVSLGGLIRYEDVVKGFNDEDFTKNRLVDLYNTKINFLPEEDVKPKNPLVASNPNFILSYTGGPGSIGGIGFTRTKRATTTKTLKTAYKKLNGDPLTYVIKNDNGDPVKEYKANPNFTRYRYGSGSFENLEDDKFSKLNTQTLNEASLSEEAPTNQLFKFYMQFIAPPSTSNNLNQKYLSFQAYVDSFNDSIGANYNKYEYVGRGYPLYKYGGFTRKIGLGFTVVAHTPDQIGPIYTKLNNLIQSIASNYSDGGHMRGNFVRLTFGDYLNNVPGIIEGFSLSPIFDAGFDIGGNGENTSGNQLPKAIKVSGFSFIPIADNNNGIMSSNSTFISYDDTITS
jgi:hypothetical protein